VDENFEMFLHVNGIYTYAFIQHINLTIVSNYHVKGYSFNNMTVGRSGLPAVE